MENKYPQHKNNKIHHNHNASLNNKRKNESDISNNIEIDIGDRNQKKVSIKQQFTKKKQEKINQKKNNQQKQQQISQKGQQFKENGEKLQLQRDRELKLQKPLCQFVTFQNCQQKHKCNNRHAPSKQICIDPSAFSFNLDTIRMQNKVDEDEVSNLQYELMPKESILADNHNLILIRHGLSLYNYVGNKFIYETGRTFKDESALTYQLSEDLIDSGLHFYGKIQCSNQQQQANQLKIHTIFVSPQLRALETCFEIFKNHPDFINKKLKIIVLPYLTEILSKIQDVSYQTHSVIRERFEKLGFSFQYLTSSRNKHSQDLWQYHNLVDANLKLSLQQQMKQENLTWKDVCINEIQSRFPKPVETYEMVFERRQIAKKFIRNYMYNNNLFGKQKPKICLISHHGFLKTFTSKGIAKNGYIMEGLSLGNCQMVSFQI